MIISLPFLLATFLVYALLPDNHNLHRKALMSYVVSLFMAYLALAIVNLTADIPTVSCHILGYSILYFFMASFIWMNVMCIDMWLAFRGLRVFGDGKLSEEKRYLFYNVYAWVFPILDVLLVFIINTYGDEELSIYPGISDNLCFVESGLPSFLYLYLPMTVLMLVNCTLFILTGIKIYEAKKETRVLKHTDSKKHLHETNKQQFKIYIKLFFAMGINWMAELISFAVRQLCEECPRSASYLTDFINSIYGVFIFFIFVFKKNTWRSLKKRYYYCIGKPHLAHELSTTRATQASNFSTSGNGSVVSKKTDFSMRELENEQERKNLELKHD
ncbi:G-protein coupled receptor Mth2-like isoform X2 [Leptinotarsa decemlineata]